MPIETNYDFTNLLMRVYLDEPCRICGRLIEDADLPTLLFAGYSKKYPARSMHLRCYEGLVDMLPDIPPEKLRAIVGER